MMGKQRGMIGRASLMFLVLCLGPILWGHATAQAPALSARWEAGPQPGMPLQDVATAQVAAQWFMAGPVDDTAAETRLLRYRPDSNDWHAVGTAPGRVLDMLTPPESRELWLLHTLPGNDTSAVYALSAATLLQERSEAPILPEQPVLTLPFAAEQAQLAWHNNRLYIVAMSREQESSDIHFGLVQPRGGRYVWQGLDSRTAPIHQLLALASVGGGLYLLGDAPEDDGPQLLRWDVVHAEWLSVPLPTDLDAPVTFQAYGANHGLIFTEDGPWWQYHPITESWTPVAPDADLRGLRAVQPYQGGFLLWAEAAEETYSRIMLPVTRRGGLNWLDYSAILAYFAVLVGIGVFFSRREGDTTAFFLGNRRVPWWAVGLSIFGTALSPITYLSIPARAFAADWVFLLAYAGIVMMGPIVIYFYLPHFRRVPISTAYEYLELRFNWATRVYGSICFMLYQGLRVSFMLFLPAITLSAVTGLDIYLCIAAMGVLATLYTVMGGIEAVIWTDVLQTIVLTTGLLLAIGIVILKIDDGPMGMIATAHEADKFHMINWGWGATTATLWVVLLGNFFSSFYPQTADQTIVQRYLTTRTEKEAARAVWTNALLHIPLPLLFFGLGTALWVYFRSHPENLDPTLQNDAVLPLFIVAEFPLGLRGVIIAGIFAAAMSSLDSSVNSVASVLVNDYYRRWRRDLSERHALRVSRIISLAFGMLGTVAAMFVARLNALSLWDPFLEFLGLVGSGLAGVVALGVFTTRTHGNGAMAGAVLSAVVLLVVRETSIHFFLYAVIGFMTAFVGGWLASFVLPGTPKQVVAENQELEDQ